MGFPWDFYGDVLEFIGIYDGIPSSNNKPPIFDGWNPTHENGDEWGMVYYCYTNIRWLSSDFMDFNGIQWDFIIRIYDGIPSSND